MVDPCCEVPVHQAQLFCIQQVLSSVGARVLPRKDGRNDREMGQAGPEYLRNRPRKLGIPHGYGNPHLHQLLDIYEIMNIYQYCGYDSLFILLGGLEHEFNFHSWADSIQSDFHIFRGGGLYSTNQTVYI